MDRDNSKLIVGPPHAATVLHIGMGAGMLQDITKFNAC